MVENKIKEQGVDTSHFIRTKEDRVGIYFAEFGALPRLSTVLYDRAGSAISKITPEDVNWEVSLSESKVFHTTGITPALGQSAAEATALALKTAKEKVKLVSFDLNYRARLWSEERAQEALTPMMKYVEILISTEEDAWRVFKVGGEDFKEVARKLSEKFGFKTVVITIRENITVWRNNWAAIAYQDGKFYDDRKYELEVVDRIGSGDSFAAGFLYGYLTGEGDAERGLKYGNAAAALKHTIPGDLNWCTLSEIEELIEGEKGLRIKR